MKQIFCLAENIREDLGRVVRASTSPIRLVFRARIILLACEGKSHFAIVRILNTTFSTVRKWLLRFIQNPNLESLEDAPRSGRPPIILAAAKCEVMKFACSEPKAIGADLGNIWTIKNLQKCVEESMGVLLSKSEVHRILNHSDLRPHKVEMWLHSPDPLFQEKVTKISSLYLNPPDDGIVLCIDEKSGMQALERERSVSSRDKGCTVRLDYEYKRHGTQTLLACFEVKTGQVFGHCGKTRKTEDLMEFMEAVAQRYPDQKVYIVWDNLNIHHGYRWDEFNQRHGNRFHFVYTPVHGSWTNQIEIWFGILQRKLIKYGSFVSEQELRDKVLSFIENWNAVGCHPFKWQFRGYLKEAA
ncbi:MAG: IS630 family transposase [Candidatus Saccharimonadales bacterium]